MSATPNPLSEFLALPGEHRKLIVPQSDRSVAASNGWLSKHGKAAGAVGAGGVAVGAGGMYVAGTAAAPVILPVLAASTGPPGWLVAALVGGGGWLLTRRAGHPFPAGVVPMSVARQLSFPGGGPEEGTLYGMHPHRPTVYYPFATFRRQVLEDRANELLRVLLDVGASLVEFTINEGRHGGFDVGPNGASADVRIAGRVGTNSDRSSKLTTKLEAPGRQSPVLDERAKDLSWYRREPSWQAIYMQRRDHGITSHEVEITDSDDYGVTASVAAQAAKAKLKLGGTYSSSASTHWRWYVRFPPAARP